MNYSHRKSISTTSILFELKLLTSKLPHQCNHHTSHTMRKIESQMCQAIQSNKNWKSGNTEVITNDTTSNVYLHGNLIATVTDTDMTIFDGGWQSNTTKSRLNALCQEFCISGECVFQSNFLWYVRKFVGKINGQSIFKTEDFVSGYLFA